MAKCVIDRTYSNAREAAKANVREYARGGAMNEAHQRSQLGNFTKRIVVALAELGYDKGGERVSKIVSHDRPTGAA